MNLPVNRNVTSSDDLEELRSLLRPLLGKPCWRADLSYGDELMLHFGAQRPYTQQSMAGRTKGEWVLGMRASEWRIDCSPEQGAPGTSLRDIIRQLEGGTVQALEPTYPDLGLTLTLSNGCTLVVTPDEDGDGDLAYWELFMPDHWLLQVGPGRAWSHVRSDVPR